jgi:hypothetical protein
MVTAGDLGPRGQRLWDDLGGADAEPADRVLIEEAARLADRLDVLDRVLTTGGDWLTFKPVLPDGSIVRVVVTGVLAEARQQQATLKQLLGELRQSRAGSKPMGRAVPTTSATGKEVPAGVADFGAFAATRSPKAAG